MTGNYARRIALNLHEFKNATWLILGYILTESTFFPMLVNGHQLKAVRTRRPDLWSPKNHHLRSYTALHWSRAMYGCSALTPVSTLSYGFWPLVLSRIVVGTGTSGLELLIVIIINDLVQLYELPLWTSATNVFCTLGLMLGGPVGAALTDHVGYQSVFAIEVCAMALTIIVLFTTLRLPESKDQSSPHAAKRIEFPSAALLLLAVGAPLFAINLGGQVFPWSHPLVIVLLSTTPLFVAGFYYVDTRIAITPIVPRRFIFNRNVAIALACTLPMKFVFD
ncbi:hypothetical protein LTS09_012024 [Friedmanniomyces endolithicus]|nr:hypothetical protein LTS09_012024 [Friedmanniomyces endolithicus]